MTNPVLSALDELQSEVEDITLGFETRLRRIKREGARAFSSNDDVEDIKVPEDDTSERLDQPENMEPEVSILPVPVEDKNGQSDTKEKVLESVAQAILGRSEEEVAEAFDRAEAQDSGEHQAEKVEVTALRDEL